MKFKFLPCLLALVSFTANAQNFYVYQGSEVTTSDLRYPGLTKFVTRVFLYKAPSNSNTTVYVPQFSYDFSYDSTKLANPQYFVMDNSSPLLSTASAYSLSQGIYTITPGSDVNYNTTSMDDGTNVIHRNVAITSSGSCSNGMVGVTFGGSVYAYEVFRVYFDIVAQSPPALSSLVYKDPDVTNYVIAMGPGGGISSPGINALLPASPPWLVWPYTTVSGASPTWEKCNNMGSGNPSTWSSTGVGGLVRGFGTPLPVTLVNMEVLKTGQEVVLKWQTVYEVNNSHFEIEHSADGLKWQQIGKEQGNGNSGSLLDYQYNDRTPLYGTNYYRIKQVDYNGAYAYSPTKSVTFGMASDEVIIYPNPASGKIYIAGVESANITIVDALGKVTLTRQNVKNGQVNIESLSKGIYSIQVENEEGTVFRQKLVIE